MKVFLKILLWVVIVLAVIFAVLAVVVLVAKEFDNNLFVGIPQLFEAIFSKWGS